jgi:hypothetical protein
VIGLCGTKLVSRAVLEGSHESRDYFSATRLLVQERRLPPWQPDFLLAKGVACDTQVVMMMSDYPDR